eukprot:COSAG01_NODE_29706_length_631_cov_5.306391_1_plen_46_part_10
MADRDPSLTFQQGRTGSWRVESLAADGALPPRDVGGEPRAVRGSLP